MPGNLPWVGGGKQTPLAKRYNGIYLDDQVEDFDWDSFVLLQMPLKCGNCWVVRDWEILYASLARYKSDLVETHQQRVNEQRFDCVNEQLRKLIVSNFIEKI